VTHFCSFKVTHTKNTIWNTIRNRILARGKKGQHHPRRRRALCLYIIRLNRTAGGICTQRTPLKRSSARVSQSAATVLPGGKNVLPSGKEQFTSGWCWIILGEQTRVIPRERRRVSSGGRWIPASELREGMLQDLGGYCRAFLARRRGARKLGDRDHAGRRDGGLKMDWTKPLDNRSDYGC